MGWSRRWSEQTLAQQFLQAGTVVAVLAFLVVSLFVTNAIEASVTRNTAAATALYVDSVIAPLLPNMRTEKTLDDTVERALDETLSQGALGRRLVAFRLWRGDGTILYADEKHLIGQTFSPSANLRAAFAGEVVAEFDRIDEPESETQRQSGLPLLEIYNPVLQPWSGEVVAVAEFYEIAHDFETSLARARLTSWSAVGAATFVFFAALFAIVLRGSRLIEHQKQALAERVDELYVLLAQNEFLRMRIQRASGRAAALNEKYLRQIGADLHDGPAQLIALAALKLDSKKMTAATTSRAERSGEIASIKAHLDDALHEIRTLCRGLVLPEIETASTDGIIEMAVAEYRQRTGVDVRLSLDGRCRQLSTAEKICIYRFVQEALNNGFRHARGRDQRVESRCDGDRIRLDVADGGDGFDPDNIRPGAIGLAGLRERIESLGGQFDISTAEGTRLSMRLGEDLARPI